VGYGDLRKGRVSLPGQEYLVTTVCAGRRPVFARPSAAQHLAGELARLDNERLLRWLAWVILPDHFHGLLALRGSVSLARCMQRLKGRSARAVGGRIWQPGYHDHALRADEDRFAAARYVLANPVRAGLAESLRDYPHWFCAWHEAGDDPDELLIEPGPLS
jgi:REP element-mobilizing transposase RayT